MLLTKAFSRVARNYICHVLQPEDLPSNVVDQVVGDIRPIMKRENNADVVHDVSLSNALADLLFCALEDRRVVRFSGVEFCKNATLGVVEISISVRVMALDPGFTGIAVRLHKRHGFRGRKSCTHESCWPTTVGP